MSLDLTIRKKNASANEAEWSENITHNLTKMAEKVSVRDFTLYDLLWHPENIGFIEVTGLYKVAVYEGLFFMLYNRQELEKYNPTNGWGCYLDLLNFVYSLSQAISNMKDEEYEILAST